MPPEVAIVTGGDEPLFDLLQGLVRSIRDKPESDGIPILVFDLGLTSAQRAWLAAHGASTQPPPLYPGFAAAPLIHLLFARPLIPELFPGHRVYVWIDADAWVQRWAAVEALIEAARRSGFAAALEDDASYRAAGRDAVAEPALAAFGAETAARHAGLPPVNAGVFAGTAEAPHWQSWARTIAENLDRARAANQVFLLDQTALGVSLREGSAGFASLSPSVNWLCHLAAPMLAADGATWLDPRPPHLPLGILHLAARVKRQSFPVPRIDGPRAARPMTYQAPSTLPEGDYASPGLPQVALDPCFPEMMRAGHGPLAWVHLGRRVAQNRYLDRRFPERDFLTRDEALVIHALALRLGGAPALRSGHATSWCVGHLAAGGVALDVQDFGQRPELVSALKSAAETLRVPLPVRIIQAPGRAGIEALRAGRPAGWSLFVVDGGRGEALGERIAACLAAAAPDAALVFPCLGVPDAPRLLARLSTEGWRIRLCHTVRILVVACRGGIEPPSHRPDPGVAWEIPAPLQAWHEAFGA